MTASISRFLAGYVDFKNLEPFLEKEKGAGGLSESFFLALTGQCLSFLALSLAFAFGYLAIPDWAAIQLGQVVSSLFVMTVIVNTLIFYITAALVFAGSKLLGGKGAFGTQAYLMGIVTFAAAAVSFPVIALAVLLPRGGLALLIQLVALLLGAYQLYAFYLLVRAAHGISMFRALVVMLATVVTIWLLFGFATGQPLLG